MNASIPPTRRGEFIAGLKATLPLEIGAAPFAIIFGATGLLYGLSPAAVAGMSAFVFAGSAQFIGATMYGAGASLGVIVLTTFVVNLRHALYAATLAPYMKHLPQRWLFPLGFTLTDESFVIAIQRYEQPDASPYKHWFYLGSVVLMYVNWQFWTWVGIFAGQRIPDPSRWGLDFALTVTFIGMMIPLLKNRPTVLAAVSAGVTAVLANGLPNKLGLLVAALVGVIAGLLAQQVFGKPQDTSTPETTVEESIPS